ncbi:MAG: TVP38/TMEM64 family protein [Candidatus Omnitrophota bacterium]
MHQSKIRSLVKFIIFIILFIFFWYLGRRFNLDVEQIRQKFSEYPLAASGLIFIVSYVGLTSLIWFGPHDVLRIAAAILFGANTSTLFIWIGEILNSFVMFHLSRFLGRDYVERRTKINPEKLDQVGQDHSVLGVVAWKINPFIPGRFTDLGYGLTNISFRRYVVPAALANLPRIYWQQYILSDLGITFAKDFNASVNYFLENTFFARYTLVYMLIVMVISILAGRQKFKRQKSRE